jgi:hypothetical protein
MQKACPQIHPVVKWQSDMTHALWDTDRAPFTADHCSYVNSVANLRETNCCCCTCPEFDILPCTGRHFKPGGVSASFTTFLEPHTRNVRDSVTASMLSNYPMRCDYTQFYCFKLLYMFQVVTPPIIRSAYNCNYSIWYKSHYCLPPLWPNVDCSPHLAAMAGGNNMTCTRRCSYSYMHSWWWVELPPETCTAVCSNKNCI